MGVDISNDQMWIYCWGTNENKVVVEPVTQTDCWMPYRRPALGMPFLTVIVFSLNQVIVNSSGCNWKKD